ncbi:MAG: flagellar export chaperone FliS [Nevskiaceae bacterium]|jgi:flagellar protein FliS|nr:MAG: flagellar export chaperone FliS [Nevskiaceae bacterium]TAM28178.1 MAG: flagellar export chaperone FliS [Nevskiaceae bacterium]
MASPFNPLLRQYQQTNAAAVFTASPHKLIEMCLAGALERIAIARGAMSRGEMGEKARRISAAVAIVEHLQISLDKSAGGELAANLDRLYDYIVRRLAQANASNDPSLLDEVGELLGQIKAGWDSLASNEVRAVTTQALGAAA